MRPAMRNTLFAAIFLFGTNTFTRAQPAVTSATTIRSSGNISGMAPAMATTEGYYFSDNQLNEADMKSKEVSKEIVTPKNGDIYIENTSRSVIVKTWDQQKVKVTTTVYYEGDSKLTDDEWLDRMNLSLKTLGSSIKIKSGNMNGGNFMNYTNGVGMFSSGSGNVSVFNSTGQNIGTKNNLKRIVTITVPAGSKIDIESKYSDVQLPANIGDVNIDITNGNLEGENIHKLILRSKYSSVNIGDVKTAEIELTNGRFSAKNIDDLDIDSKYSSIEMAAARKLIMRSTNDEYEVEEAGEVRGRKSYGNLRITKLNNSMELDGVNADVRVRNVGPSLSLIKLDDKYADIRIPLRNTKNYSIDFSGAYSSVYGNFEKKISAEVADKKQTSSPSMAPSVATVNGVISARSIPLHGMNMPAVAWSGSEGNGPAKFTAAVGDGSGLKIDIKCQNCTVDFK